jgi:hypothetical protein
MAIRLIQKIKKRDKMKKLNQLGMLSLHVLVPAVIAIAAVGGIGAYVLTKSNAQKPSDMNYSCGTLKREGRVYYSAVGTNAKFTSATDSDSIRNIAFKLCKKNLLDSVTARSINNNGNYKPILKTQYAKWQAKLGYSGADADGVPGAKSLNAIGLTPVGF